MFRLGLALSLAFVAFIIGCGGGATGTGPGGNNGNGGNTVGMTELPVFAVYYNTHTQKDESFNETLRRATGQNIPIFGWKFEAWTCEVPATATAAAVTSRLIHKAETSEFTVFWDGLKVVLPNHGCVRVKNNIDIPRDVNNIPQKWEGEQMIEDTSVFNKNTPPVFKLIGGGGW